MQPRNAAILFLVAALLGAFVYLSEIQGEAGREAAERQTRRMFPDVEAGDVAFLAFRTRDDRAFEALREGAGWLIQSPLVFDGDAVSLDAMASAIANLETETRIEDPGAPAIYGLGELARWVRFRVGSETFALGVGADTPVGGEVYVAREGSEGVYTVPSFRVSSFDREFADLRDKRVFDFDRTRVESIVVGWPGASVTVERTKPAQQGEPVQAENWRIVHPAYAAGAADDAVVDGLLSDLAFLRAEGFVDGGDLAIDGDAFVTVRLGLQAREGEPLEIGLRAVADPAGDDFLVRGGSATSLYRVARGRISELPRDVFAYRFKQLSRFEVGDARAFEVEFANSAEGASVEPLRVRVERATTGWKASGPEWLPGKAGGLMAELARLQAVSVVREDAAPDALADLGLSPPRVVLRAYGSDDGGAGAAPLLAEVELGRDDEGLGIVARTAGTDVIYRIDETLAEALPIDLARFEAAFLAPPAAEPPDATP